MNIWKNFKNKHPKTAKTLKWVGGIAIVGGLCVVIEKTLGKNPQIGNFNSRAHFRKDGIQKVGYSNKYRANFQVIHDRFVYQAEMKAYLCPFCGKFHVGHCFNNNISA